MRRFTALAAILILLSWAAPLLACASGSKMNQQERACCSAMHGNCGGMAGMECCRSQVRSDAHPPIIAASPQLHLHLAVTDWLAATSNAVRQVPPFLLQAPDEHSPPGLLVAQLDVLRI